VTPPVATPRKRQHTQAVEKLQHVAGTVATQTVTPSITTSTVSPDELIDTFNAVIDAIGTDCIYDLIAKGIPEKIIAYTSETDIPIFGEFCYKNGYYEHILQMLRSKVAALDAAIKDLEIKKKCTLERMIYAGELNATIGVHLFKAWREEETNANPKTNSQKDL